MAVYGGATPARYERSFSLSLSLSLADLPRGVFLSVACFAAPLFCPRSLLGFSQDFLNGVCTNTVVMQERQMKYWGGNYDTFNRTKDEQDINQVG